VLFFALGDEGMKYECGPDGVNNYKKAGESVEKCWEIHLLNSFLHLDPETSSG